MEWQMKPSIACDFDVFQGGSNTIGRTRVGSAVLFPYLSKPYQKEAHVLSSATPSASSGTSCTAATAGASFDSASSGFIPASNFAANCGSKGEPIVGDIKEPEKQQDFSERYVFCTAKAPTPPPSSALTIVPNCSKRTFAQDKSIDLEDQISPLSKRVTITSVMNDPNSEYLKLKQHRTPVTAAITHRTLQRCQIDGCKEDLGKAKKEYHRRHKVCEMHSKAPRVMKSGLEQRFCQQCSRFHVVGEFDDAKRSCRRRLEGHNKRRRKSNCQDIASFSLTSLDYEKLHLSHLMQRHQLAMPLSNMKFNYQNNDAQQLVEWPATDLQHEQQQRVAMTTLQANYFNEINNRLRAILNEQINKGSSASSSSLLDLLQEQQEQVSSCMQGKGLSLCTASANGPPTCALSLLSSQPLPEPIITLHQETRRDQKPPNYPTNLTNHPHQNFTTIAGLSSAKSNNAITHPQSPFSLTNQPKSLALSMGMSAASSALKEKLYQKHIPPIPNPDNMALIQSLAPHNPILARLVHEAATSHHQPEQLGMAMEFNS